MTARLGKALAVAALLTGALAVGAQGSGATSGTTPGTPAQVAALVKASLSITTLPSDLTPSLQQAADDPNSALVDGANYVKNSCNPYWTHREATKPVPCYYGDLKSHEVVALWGDSNAGMWAPALSAILDTYHYKLALFGFFGCDTSFLPETSSQPGFAGEWKLCNEWHASLPAAVRRLHPVIVAEASTPLRAFDATENALWVKDMALAFNELTKGAPSTIRMEIGSIPAHTTPAYKCLEAYPTAVQQCDVSYAASNSPYQVILNRDASIAKSAHAVLIPTWPWLCYSQTCSPVIGTYLAQLDEDHVSTPYDLWLTTVLEDAMVAGKVLPKTP